MKTAPTTEELRAARDELVARYRNHPGFAGAGISDRHLLITFFEDATTPVPAGATEPIRGIEIEVVTVGATHAC